MLNIHSRNGHSCFCTKGCQPLHMVPFAGAAVAGAVAAQTCFNLSLFFPSGNLLPSALDAAAVASSMRHPGPVNLTAYSDGASVTNNTFWRICSCGIAWVSAATADTAVAAADSLLLFATHQTSKHGGLSSSTMLLQIRRLHPTIPTSAQSSHVVASAWTAAADEGVLLPSASS